MIRLLTVLGPLWIFAFILFYNIKQWKLKTFKELLLIFACGIVSLVAVASLLTFIVVFLN